MGDACRERRRGGRRAAGWRRSRSAFLAAFMAAGLFEYNFGDSEILMFTLLVSALPYALRRQRDAPGGRRRMKPRPRSRARRLLDAHARTGASSWWAT